MTFLQTEKHVPPSLQHIEAQALQLSPQEREQLAERLWLSLDAASTQDDWRAAWAQEITTRVTELESGVAELIPADQVMARLRQKLDLR